MSTRKTVAVENTAQAFLEMLEALGVRYLIGNAGTDFASIIDAFSRRAVDGKVAPRAMIVAHECCAVSMAHGYYLVTGEPAVVMVHTTPGTANAALLSIEMILACGCGERSILMCSRPSSATSRV